MAPGDDTGEAANRSSERRGTDVGPGLARTWRRSGDIRPAQAPPGRSASGSAASAVASSASRSFADDLALPAAARRRGLLGADASDAPWSATGGAGAVGLGDGVFAALVVARGRVVAPGEAALAAFRFAGFAGT